MSSRQIDLQRWPALSNLIDGEGTSVLTVGVGDPSHYTNLRFVHNVVNYGLV